MMGGWVDMKGTGKERQKDHTTINSQCAEILFKVVLANEIDDHVYTSVGCFLGNLYTHLSQSNVHVVHVPSALPPLPILASCS